MTRRDLIIAGAAAAVVLLVGAGVVAIAWPDSPTKPTAVTSVPTVPPAPVIPSDSEASPSPSSTDGSGDNGDGTKKDNRKPADAPPLANAAPAGQGQLPSASPVNCPAATVTVSDANGLAEALKNATPGASIALADGQYVGKFIAAVSGTADRPIFLCGGAGAVLDGDNVRGGYVLHLNKATHWRLVGFTVTNGQKGVVADSTVGSVIQGLTVHDVGDEAIHLRNNSTDNVVLQNTIRKTGLRRDKFGEGVYIGTAVSNWCTVTDCQPDRSDRNVVKGNNISQTTSESVDIKEGTTGGVLEGNTFDGSSLKGADSWVDVKGNNWLIKQNTGTNSPMDGFQTHQILPGWGDHNLFSGNVAAVNGPGLGFALRPTVANAVGCDNRATGARAGLSNIPCH
jgi:hypothetical protein